MKIILKTITGVVHHVSSTYDTQLIVIALFFLAMWVITLLLTLMKNDYLLELEEDVKVLSKVVKKLTRRLEKNGIAIA